MNIVKICIALPLIHLHQMIGLRAICNYCKPFQCKCNTKMKKPSIIEGFYRGSYHGSLPMGLTKVMFGFGTITLANTQTISGSN